MPFWLKVTFVLLTWPISLPLLAFAYGLGFFREPNARRAKARRARTNHAEADDDAMALAALYMTKPEP